MSRPNLLFLKKGTDSLRSAKFEMFSMHYSQLPNRQNTTDEVHEVYTAEI